MSERNGSNPFTQTLPRPERRRQARDARKKLQSPDERQLLVKEGLSSLAHQTGLAALMRLMEQDADQACGAKGKWEQNSEGRIGSRNGWGPGTVWLGGFCVQIQRPRAVRAKSRGGGELPIESYQQAQNPEFLSNAALTATMLGVSLRNHAKVVGAVNPVTQELRISGLSKSTIGRRFIAAADELLSTFLRRPLDQRYLVVWVDAVAEGDYSVLAAVGLTVDGTKKVLGLRQGSTETADFCTEFLEELMHRGLSAKQGILWVVDGATGMLKALREVFGEDVLIQRCRLHKGRNVADKLTLGESEKKAFAAELEEAWAIQDPTVAKAKLELLARGLEASGQAAAAKSLREGIQDMLTCCRLGVPPDLMASLTNTNVIESTFSVHEAAAHRVKYWRNGKQVLRWVAASCCEAQRAFERVGNPDSLGRLARALERHVGKNTAQSEPPLAIAC